MVEFARVLDHVHDASANRASQLAVAHNDVELPLLPFYFGDEFVQFVCSPDMGISAGVIQSDVAPKVNSPDLGRCFIMERLMATSGDLKSTAMVLVSLMTHEC